MIGLIIGRIRCGKSTLAIFLVEKRKRVIFVDRTGEMGPVDHVVRNYPDDCMEIDWNAEELRVSWRCQAEWEFFNSLTDITLVIDEADTHWTTADGRVGAGGVVRDPELMQLIARGGHYGIDILLIVQYPFQMPRFMRSQAARVYLLSLREERDIRYVWNCWRLVPPEARYKYVMWSDGGANDAREDEGAEGEEETEDEIEDDGGEGEDDEDD